MGLPQGCLEEAKEIAKLSVPIVIASCLSITMNIVDIAMVGHLGELELAAAGLANLTFNFLHFPLVGASTALDTLLSQSWGAKNYESYKEWSRTGFIVLMALGCLVCLLLACSKELYDAIDQKPELAKMAGKFCINLIPGYFPFIVYLVLTKYLQTQGILNPSVVVGLLSNLFNAIVNYLLIYYWRLGFEGAPIATSIARWFQMFLLLGYVYVTYPSHSKTWPSFQMPHNIQRKVSEFLRLGIPGALMFGLEAWAFEASTLMATYLDTVSLDAHTILLNTCAFTFVSLAFALGIVGSIRVGHLLGSNNGAQAKLATRVLLVFVLLVQSALAVFYITARNYIGMIYSNDAEVIAKVATLSHIAGIFQVCDGIAAYVGGILKGMGHQIISAGLNLVGFWIIGTMLGGVLTFECSWGVSGIWWGLCAGLFAASSCGMYIISRIDFDKEAGRAQKRVEVISSYDETAGDRNGQLVQNDEDDRDDADNSADDIELMKNVISSSA